MAAGSPQRQGVASFTAPDQVNHRRYEALRAFFVEGLSHAQAGERFGYTRWAMVNLVREYRAGKLELFAPPGVATAKDRARGRVIELRRQGLSTYEISARLAGEGTPLNRTSVGEILTEEGFGRLLRHPAEAASTAVATPGRDTRLPRTATLDFATWPARCDSAKAGLLLLVPDLVALDLPALVAQAGYPGTRVVPAASWLLSLLALKLTRTRRVSHVDDLLLTDPAAALLAGLTTLPKKTALTDYSYRTSHNQQRAFLTALDTKMIAGGLATSDEAIFDLDFHAIMHWGTDPALEKHYVPTRSQRARSVLTFFAQDSGTHNLVYANADLSKATQNREFIAFCDHWKKASGNDPHMLVMTRRSPPSPCSPNSTPAGSSSSPCGCAPPPCCATSTPSDPPITRRSPWTGPATTTGPECTNQPSDCRTTPPPCASSSSPDWAAMRPPSSSPTTPTAAPNNSSPATRAG
jgi:hypothetical protein